ncbi:MAG: SH3 domain-containing protein, partial [Chloroflexota bacterium]|nr:SH3 domain-containing protein [Chloroflexota bacterium]
QKVFDRRDFIKAATIVGASIALTACNPNDEESMAEALEQTLQAREKEGASEEIEDKPSEPEETIPTDTATPTKTATKAPTQTPTNTPTNTPTEVPTPRGEVTTAHSMFKGPQTNHPFIKKTTLGEEVTILGRTDDGVWYKIMDSDGTMGWCYSEFIKLITDVSVPVIYNIPTPVPAPCDCDTYSAPCSCDSHSVGCTCDQVCTCDTVHYWYPN